MTPTDEKPLPCGHLASHHETDIGPICWECEAKRARLMDKDEKTILGYVSAPDGKHRLPAYVRTAAGKFFKAELDDFCTFAHYRAIDVPLIEVLDAAGKVR